MTTQIKNKHPLQPGSRKVPRREKVAMKPTRTCCLVLLAALLGGMLLVSSSKALAQSASSDPLQPASISPLKPPSLVPAPNGEGEEKRPAYDSVGVIDSFEDERIVVSDAGYDLAPDIKFYNKNLRVIGSGSFTEGTYVGVILDSAHRAKGVYLLE